MSHHEAFTHAAFQRHLNEHRLMAARETSSGKLYLPPRPLCPESRSTDMTWDVMSGRGTLLAFSVVHIVPTAMQEAGYSRKNPYCVGVVELEEGPRISGQILGVDVSHPESIEVGTKVEVKFVDRGEGDERKTFLAFETVS